MSESALRARYTAANIPTYLLRCLAATVTEFGVNAHRLTTSLGFTVEDLANPACRVSFRQGSAMIRRALQATGDRGLGLEIGKRETVASIGLVGFAMITCRTFGDAVMLGVRQQKFAGSMLDFDVRHEGSAIVMTASNRFHEPDIHIFLVEEAFASFLQIARGLLGPEIRPLRIDLAYPPPAYAAAYGELFGCEVRFGQMANVFVADAGWTDRPLATHDPLSHRQTLEFLEQSAARDEESAELVASVERLLRKSMAEPLSLPEVAAQLGLSERTLRRRLTEHGVSFQQLLDNLRKVRALELLANAALSVEQVAAAVGFSGAHNFRRAFRRWTGSAPSELRDGGEDWTS